MKLLVKAWMNGKHQEVDRFEINDVALIKHRTDGIDLILVGGRICQYSSQCIITFL